jgi:hypothetical protein
MFNHLTATLLRAEKNLEEIRIDNCVLKWGLGGEDQGAGQAHVYKGRRDILCY